MNLRLLLIIPFASFITACAGVSLSPSADSVSQVDPQMTTGSTVAVVTVDPEDLQFGDGASTPVISKAQKFVIPVPAFEDGGEPLVYPADSSQAGNPILDYEGKPIGERGLVFFNQADQTVQAVAGDGEGVIIINEVTTDQADALHRHILTLNPDPAQLTLEQLRQALTFAQEDLDLGDMYNSNRSFIEENMSSIDTWAMANNDPQSDPLYGFKKRDDRDIGQAVYIPGRFEFAGPAATPQLFENGGVIVQQQEEFRGVQPDVFLRTYSFSDGQPIAEASDLATQQPF